MSNLTGGKKICVSDRLSTDYQALRLQTTAGQNGHIRQQNWTVCVAAYAKKEKKKLQISKANTKRALQKFHRKPLCIEHFILPSQNKELQVA